MQIDTDESMLWLKFVLFLAALAGACGFGKNPPVFDHEVDLPTIRPLIIAHRGSSGRLPEHSLAAYQLAIDEGADIIECDMCVTRDLKIVCSHESWLSGTTNVADVYPESRMNTYFIQLQNKTDYFTVDFTLDELKLVMRRQTSSIRDPNYDDMYPMVGFEEFIETARNADPPRGVHCETKDSSWVNSLDFIQAANTTFEDLALSFLHSHDCTDSTDPCFLQSFSFSSAEYMSTKTNLPVVPLSAVNLSNETLEELSQYAYGIGASRSIVVRTINDQIIDRSDFIDRAHGFGLKVHVYTLKNEDRHLPWDYGQDPYNEYQDYLNLMADGAFTDFPGTYSNFLDKTYGCNTTFKNPN